MGGGGAVFSKRYSSTCVVGDNGPSDIGGVQYIPSVGAHVAGVEMEKMGHIPVRTDEVSDSADVQQPPLCFDN